MFFRKLKKSMKNDNVYLEQILDSARKIRDFVNGFDKKRFYTDQKTQSAVIMQLALIGELARKISDETRSNISLPWKDIVGFRDRAIHDYYQIDLEIVWATIPEDLEILETELTKYLPE